MESIIKNMPDLRAAYPEYSDFIEKMYVSWLQFMVAGKGDERPATQSFVKNLTQVAPDEAAIRHLVEFSNAHSDEVSPHATACWIVLIASDPNEELPEVDADLFLAWKQTRPLRT
jgi:hypothetical protein